VIDPTGQAAVFESVEDEAVEGALKKNSFDHSDRTGGIRHASNGPIDVLILSGGTFGIGIPAGCAVGVDGDFRSGSCGRFDRHRCWKRIDG
jgi:hypothetical protein